jgi:hypothetical protein
MKPASLPKLMLRLSDFFFGPETQAQFIAIDIASEATPTSGPLRHKARKLIPVRTGHKKGGHSVTFFVSFRTATKSVVAF